MKSCPDASNLHVHFHGFQVEQGALMEWQSLLLCLEGWKLQGWTYSTLWLSVPDNRLTAEERQQSVCLLRRYTKVWSRSNPGHRVPPLQQQQV